jgi:hypothetical protein
MITSQRQELTRLEQQFPSWETWVINRVNGGPLWCACAGTTNSRWCPRAALGA